MAKSKSKSKRTSKSKSKTSKGLIAGLSIGGVVVLIAGTLVVLHFMGVFDKLFKKKPSKSNTHKNCRGLKKGGSIDNNTSVIKNDLLTEGDQEMDILDLEVNGSVLTANLGPVGSIKVDIDKKTLTFPSDKPGGGMITEQVDMLYNESLNLIICISKDGDTEVAIDASYFGC